VIIVVFAAPPIAGARSTNYAQSQTDIDGAACLSAQLLMHVTNGFDQPFEGQVRAAQAFLEQLQNTSPGVVRNFEFRRSCLRNFPDGVWILDRENSIGAVERIPEDMKTPNCADNVPTFLGGR
jgi:hypothetical protein